MTTNNWTVALESGNGAGAFGSAGTFAEAHLLAWQHWVSTFTWTFGPVCAYVSVPNGESPPEGLTHEEAAMVPPPADVLAGLLAEVPPDDEVDDDLIDGTCQEVSHDLRDLREAWVHGGPTRARLHIAGAIRQLLDLDRTLRLDQERQARARTARAWGPVSGRAGQ